MSKKSLPQIRREIRGIKQSKDPLKAQAGRKGAVVANAKRANIPIEEALKSEHFKQLARASNSFQAMGGKHADELIANELRYTAKNINNQYVNRLDVNDLFAQSTTEVASNLVNLAMGKDGFETTPANVQRLAMLDVLKLSGVDNKILENQNPQIAQFSRDELERFIKASEMMLDSLKIEVQD